MKKLNRVSAILLGVMLSGCSSDEKIDGKREELIPSLSISVDMDSSIAELDAATESQDYAQPFFNATHCYNPLALNTNLKERWTSDLDFSVSKELQVTASPIVADGKVFCVDAGGVVYAISKSTGKRLWRLSTTIEKKSGQIGTAMAYVDGKLIVTTTFGECFSIDANTGKILWRVKLLGICKGDGVTVSKNKAFIMCSNSRLQVLDVNTGKTLWSHSGVKPDTTFIGSSGVAVSNGVAYVAYPSGEIFALREDTGSISWNAALSKYSLINGAQTISHPRACPVVKGDLIYFVSSNGQTVALDKNTGSNVWSCEFGGLQTPSVSGNSLFVLDSQAGLICLNRSNGKVRWSTRLVSENRVFNWYGQFLTKDFVVLLSPAGELIYVSVKTGKIDHIVKLNENVSVNPVVANGQMFILCDSGKVKAYK